MKLTWCLVFVVSLFGLCFCNGNSDNNNKRSSKKNTRHTNNWAVIVDASIFYFNYRHISNALSMYRSVKKMGIPDSQIILMLADDMACHPSNTFKAQMFNNADHQIELYGDSIEVDYRGREVTVENFLRVLTGRHHPGTPASKRLNTDAGSNIFVYMSGHGGDQFLKFQDFEEISSQDIGEALKQMKAKGRFKEMYFSVDTCQAATLGKAFDTPGVLFMGSSLRHENSYSHHLDQDLGTSVIDRFTYYTLDYMFRKGNKANFQEYFDSLTYRKLQSTAMLDVSNYERPPKKVLLTDFLGSVLKIVTDLEPQHNVTTLQVLETQKATVEFEEILAWSDEDSGASFPDHDAQF